VIGAAGALAIRERWPCPHSSADGDRHLHSRRRFRDDRSEERNPHCRDFPATAIVRTHFPLGDSRPFTGKSRLNPPGPNAVY
jgi:hypothetical protein